MMEKDYRQFASLPSTNLYAKENCRTFDKNKIVIIQALEQTAGYGQKKRVFYTPKNKGVWMSLCIYGELDPIVATRKMAVAIQTFLHKEKVLATIKWPNDLLVEGKKIAGILTEIVDEWLIIGVGFNLSLTNEDKKKIDQPVICLSDLTQKSYDLEKITIEIVDFFLKR